MSQSKPPKDGVSEPQVALDGLRPGYQEGADYERKASQTARRLGRILPRLKRFCLASPMQMDTSKNPLPESALI
jgi:hypothetical protein